MKYVLETALLIWGVAVLISMVSNEVNYVWGGKTKYVPSMGFELTNTNTLESKSSCLDCSDKNAFILLHAKHILYIYTVFFILITTHYALHIVCV